MSCSVPDAIAILRRLKSRQILLLIAIDETRSVRKAAMQLNMTQPAATKLLGDLETMLGVQLFERHRRGVQPTIYGETMIRHARMIVADLEHARDELAALAIGQSGHVKIGAVMSAIPFLLARAVARLKAEQPHLVVSIEVSTSDVLIPALARGDLDIVVARPLETSDPTGFAYEPLIEEPLVVAGRVDHPLVRRKSLTLGALADWPWVLLPATSPMRRVLAPLFHGIGLDRPAKIVETSSWMTMIALVQQTDMLAVLPEDVLRYHAERRLLARIPVALPPIMGAYGILTRHDRPASPGAAAFVRNLRLALSEEAGR